MSSSLVITLAVIGGAAWLAFLGVSALRARRREEVAPNQAPGRTDEELETRRLERVQQWAVLTAGFLAVGLPLYYLGEAQRQEGFTEQFAEESIVRGEHLVTEFGCFNCHGPGGSGGSASYIEKRTGVATLWAAPSLDDIMYRYEPDEVNFWITYGRPNTPMPAWGLAGGGAMNEHQVADIVSYLQTIQISQADALAKIQGKVNSELQRLEGAETTMAAAIATQAQLVASIKRAPDLAAPASALTETMDDVLEGADTGIDTDGDELSDTAEARLNELSAELVALFALPGVDSLTLDPANSQSSGRPDREAAEAIVSAMTGLVEQYPVLAGHLASLEAALAETGEDQDDDGLTDRAETVVSATIDQAIAAVRPQGLTVLALDPANPETSGEPDLIVAERGVSANEGVSLQLTVTRDNQGRLLPAAEAALSALQAAGQEADWHIDIQGVADRAFGGDFEAASRAVGLFNGHCARCHTSGWSAGLSFTQVAGSGSLGPALWEGRPKVQFLTEGDLIKFITEGSEAPVAYGVNGIGTGRMPAFGMILSAEDIELIATYLRSGDLTGTGS
ncbi:MAG: c-type cytochrome [Actinomycetota bacterium]